MLILGLSAFYHDSSACLIKDGRILSAAQEERFTRVRHDSTFPKHAINFCLKENQLLAKEIDYVVFYDKPFLKFERLLETYLAFAPRGFKSFITSMPIWLKEKLFQKKLILDHLKKINSQIKWAEKLQFSEHHLSHAASAFYPSPFVKAAVLTMDGVGEWTTTSVFLGENNNLKALKEINFPHSLGLLYSAFTFFLGFKVNSGEYKLMGLAPYGKPVYKKRIKDHLIDIKNDGSYRLNMKYFNFPVGLTMTNKYFNKLFKDLSRKSDAPILQRHMDLAASIQEVTNEIVLKICKNIKNEMNVNYLCIAGGVGLNCVTNEVISNANLFEDIWIQPAAGDAGGALGAALAFYHLGLGKKRIVLNNDAMRGAYLGPNYNQKYIQKTLKKSGAVFKILSKNQIIEETAKYLSSGKIVGWFQGKMEFGPRALGNRSILADPRSADMQKKLNLKIKFRESFRPFAPSVISEEVGNWFENLNVNSYMTVTSQIKKSKLKNVSSEYVGLEQINEVRSVVPAITHVDFSARVQTVSQSKNNKFYMLIKYFMKLTEVPMLINTSFNIRGEPIVNDPKEAFRCFIETDMDVLVIGNCILLKENQTKRKSQKYLEQYLDD